MAAAAGSLRPIRADGGQNGRQTPEGKAAGGRSMTSSNRRSVLTGGAAVAGTLALGMPSIVRAQPAKLVIGHLTPLTGFLGVLGGWAQLGIPQALDEINHAGGAPRRPLALISQASGYPPTAATHAHPAIR